jgi:ectoine hydroxylase-related dioxygenase (phytanoyl-CoA dioxygenase family)
MDVIQNGFAIFDEILMPRECDELLAALSQSDSLRSRAGARHLLSIPAVAQLAGDSRLSTLASDVLGSDAVPFRVTLFDKSEESNWSVAWHQDTALPLQSKFEGDGWGPWSNKAGVLYAHAPASALDRIVALRVHLDESTPDNGPLRVLPGTHRLGVLSDDEVSLLAHSSASVMCLAPRGAVLVMRPLLIHSSTRIVTPGSRRVLHIEYAEDLEIAPGIRLATA